MSTQIFLSDIRIFGNNNVTDEYIYIKETGTMYPEIEIAGQQLIGMTFVGNIKIETENEYLRAAMYYGFEFTAIFKGEYIKHLDDAVNSIGDQFNNKGKIYSLIKNICNMIFMKPITIEDVESP